MQSKQVNGMRGSTAALVREGAASASPKNPIDAIVIGAGPSGMVALRTLLRDDPPISVLAVDRQNVAGGIWTGHIPSYSTLQDLKCEYEVHGVKFPQQEPRRRGPRDQVAEYFEMIKPMLHRVEVKPWGKGVEDPVTATIYTRGVLICAHNIFTYLPKLPGQETATFPIKHNNDIRGASEIPKSDIIVIGTGPSAMDMVQEACISQKATNVHVVARIAHWGAPDMWWPFLHRFGWSELYIMGIFYYYLPIFVVDALLHYIGVIWAWWHGIPEWMPPKKDPVSSKVAYILRTHLLSPYKAGQFRIHNDCEIKLIQADKVTLTDDTVLYPKMLIAATGWSTDSSFLPGGEKSSEYDSLAAADIPKPLYLRFYDQEHPGVFLHQHEQWIYGIYSQFTVPQPVHRANIEGNVDAAE